MISKNIKKHKKRKDESTMSTVITIILRVVGVVLLLAGGCVGAYIYYQEKQKNEKRSKQHRQLELEKQKQQGLEKQRRQELEKQRQQELEQQKLQLEKQETAEEYCKVTEEVEKYKADAIYKKYFMRVAPVYQTLLGSLRRYNNADLSDVELLDDLETALKNAKIDEMVTENGFSVTVNNYSFDKDTVFRNCMNLDIEKLKTDLKNQKMFLKRYQFQEQVNCKQIIERSGKILYSIFQKISEKNVSGCLKIIEQLGKELEINGCYYVYMNDPCVRENESMGADFRDDVLTATELPGLYIKDALNHYHLIGTFGGTVRRR